jgi:hypothetical protein
MKRLMVVAASFAVLVGVVASGAFAGEVKGPPGTPCGGDTGVTCEESTNYTGARSNSNSDCSHSGLNDMESFGQTSSITQTPHDAPPGAPGQGTCAGGTNGTREEKGNRPTP